MNSMKTSNVLLLTLVLFLVATSTVSWLSPGSTAARANADLKSCATTSITMELDGPCCASSCSGLCEAKFQGSGTFFPQGCKCSFCRGIPPATKN